MKKLLIAIAVLSLLSLPVFAQGEVPKLEVFGGYSLIHNTSNDALETDPMTSHGFAAAVEGNVHPNIGIVAQFGFYQHTENWQDSELTIDARMRTLPFLFGPRFGYRADKVRVFAHYLLGAVRTSYLEKENGTVWDDWTETDFGQAIGGGVDVALSDSISVRPVQFDFITVKVSDQDTWVKGIGYSAGLVFKF
jgi:hypothetical protein